MLYKLEWKTPHTTPFGMTVEEWVKDVKSFEERGYLDDFDDDSIEDPRERRNAKGRSIICYAVCWRDRCKRAGRCKTRLKLALREFQPEFGIVAQTRGGHSFTFNGTPDPAKMEIMEKLFDAIEERCPNFFRSRRRVEGLSAQPAAPAKNPKRKKEPRRP